MLAHRTMMGAAGASSGYVVGNSVYGDGSTGELTKDYTVAATNRQKGTISFWVKKTKVIANTADMNVIFSVSDAATDTSIVGFNNVTGAAPDEQLAFGAGVAGGNGKSYFSPKLRDPSAYDHWCVYYDTTQAAAADRIKADKNGVNYAATVSTATTQNSSLLFGIDTGSFVHRILRQYNGYDFPGYLAAFYYIDGQALNSSSFGETDTTTGSWKPKAYTGTYGTNGFYLPFTNSSSLGDDTSGNGNNFTKTGTVTQTTDSPTDKAATNIGNFCVVNGANKDSAATISNGNLTVSATTAVIGSIGTIGVSSGKWYWEIRCDAYIGNSSQYGVVPQITLPNAGLIGSTGNGWAYLPSGNKVNAGSSVAYGSSFTTADIVGCALDMDNGKIWWSKNGTWQASGDPAAGTNAAYTNLTGVIFPAAGPATSEPQTFNFGQKALTYTPPTGFKRLCTANLPAPTIKNDDLHFNVVTYTGTGSSLSITDVGFQPDLIWIKERSKVGNHILVDSVRGVTKALSSHSTGVESSPGAIASIDSTGFTLPAISKTVLDYTGGSQNYTVPAGVTSLTVKLWGAAGGGGDASAGGAGGFVTDIIPVTPGEVLTVVVGGGGNLSPVAGHGGRAGAGGGMTAVLRSSTYLTIAGGGSGAGQAGQGPGGGGGPVGGNAGSGGNAGGGTQTAGGAAGSEAGYTGTAGSSGQGGAGAGSAAGAGGYGGGGAAGGPLGNDNYSGGGGGGYFGGGGGANGRSGGGGSSYISGVGGYTAAGGSALQQTDSDWSSGIATGTTNTTGGNGRAVLITTGGVTNVSSTTYVAWCWKGGGSGSSDTSGSITSTVSANTTAGFSVVTFTGTGANATVGHGLGAVPALIITKRRGAVDSWRVYHKNMDASPQNGRLVLESTEAYSAAATVWNSTAPTSSVFSVGTTFAADTFVAYLWAEVAGFSKFGSYTANGSTDGPFVYCGFRPRFILAKTSSHADDWVIYDTARDTYNVSGRALFADLTDAEAALSARVDFVSNGFKLRTAGLPNNSGYTFIFAAFAEFPFGGTATSQGRAR